MTQAQTKTSHQFSWERRVSSSPELPGVYWFSAEDDSVLYVGKAKNLKNRLRSYTRFDQLSRRIQLMTSSAKKLHWQILDSELEALLVEAELIHAHQPPYNILAKDDKSPLYIAITNHQLPKVIRLHKQQLRTLIEKKQVFKRNVFGPFQSGYRVMQVLKSLRRAFHWCNQGVVGKKPCFYVHIGLCDGACVGNISQEEYAEMIFRLAAFLRGKTKVVVREMKQKMEVASKQQRFEEAARLRDEWQTIEELLQEKNETPEILHMPQLIDQKVDMLIQFRSFLSDRLGLPRQLQLSRIEGYDVSNTQGKAAYISMVTFLDGEPAKDEYKVFRTRLPEKPNDYGMLAEVMKRRQLHADWGVPDLVLIDGGKGQLRSCARVWQWQSVLTSIAKDPDRLLLLRSDNTIEEHGISSLPFGTLIQRIRDEAHRFAKKHHVRRREKGMIE